MSQQDPRDIERINPENQNADTNTNNISVLGEPEETSKVKGAVVQNEEEKTEKQVFPGKGEGANKKAGGKDAA